MRREVKAVSAVNLKRQKSLVFIKKIVNFKQHVYALFNPKCFFLTKRTYKDIMILIKHRNEVDNATSSSLHLRVIINSHKRLETLPHKCDQLIDRFVSFSSYRNRFFFWYKFRLISDYFAFVSISSFHAWITYFFKSKIISIKRKTNFFTRNLCYHIYSPSYFCCNDPRNYSERYQFHNHTSI